MIEQPDDKAKYWNGPQNKAIRYYYYSQRGLQLFNEFRYIFMLIFGIYITFKFTNPLWLVGMFAISIPLLIGVGWFNVHYMSAKVDWLSIRYASFGAKYGYHLQEVQNKLLEEIKEKLK